MKKKNVITVTSVDYIQLSQLGISEQGMQDLCDSNRITFGDANHTLVTLNRIEDVFSNVGNNKDLKKIQKLIDEHGELFYIDLES